MTKQHDEENQGKRTKTAHGPAVREEKRRKWQLKQERQNHQNKRKRVEDHQDPVSSWCQENAGFATLVTEEDIDSIRNESRDGDQKEGERSDRHEDLALHLAPFWDVQDLATDTSNQVLTPTKTAANTKRLFIAEGTETVRILLQQQRLKSTSSAVDLELAPIELKSIFVKPSVLLDEPVRLVTDVQAAMVDTISNGNAGVIKCNTMNDHQPKFHVLVGRSESVLSQVAGFPVKRGALACGVCPTDRTEAWLNDYISHKLSSSIDPLRILALDGICDTANLGSMIRTASVLGINVVVVSNNTCDVWYRRTVRVSMGHVFLVPVVRVQNLAIFLENWKQTAVDRSLTSFAAVVQKDDDTVTLERMGSSSVPSAWCCVMGNEGNGISQKVIDVCTKRLRIDMADGVDSLSVPVATGILLHGLREREKRD
ncbi:SpoU rRNA methylase family protein [Nitzschia inconspicua]|uniref:SpoU rRNA methylase family protein n=1 Tax=Nitzschia inconspicua TaxID=303405 RepID=A0A9K3PZD5_9STRA|nr:SpoU rRNA methylase family protein [Nitzschia inconspicua]